MTITRMLAVMTVIDLEAAVAWYTRLLAREPDARPMDGHPCSPTVENHSFPRYGRTHGLVR